MILNMTSIISIAASVLAVGMLIFSFYIEEEGFFKKNHQPHDDE